MDIHKIFEREQKQLTKYKWLSYDYKKVGYALLVASIVGLIFTLLADKNAFPTLKLLAKDGLLVAMLLIAVTKDKVEDEFTINLRVKSFTLAFIVGMVFAVGQPYINYLVALVVKPEKAVFESMSAYAVIWFMLFVQLGFYQVLKVTR